LGTLVSIYQRFRVYLHNTSWLIGEKFLSLGISFLVTIFVARYLGPEDFGLLSYAISLAALFAAAGHMGLGGLVIREIVNKDQERGEVLGTSLGLKFIGMAIGFLALVLYVTFFEQRNPTAYAMILIAGVALLFNPLNIIDFWFQAFVQARYAAISRFLALASAASLKVILMLVGASVVWFATASLLQAAVTAVALLVFYRMHAQLKVREWRFNWQRAKELFSQGWLVYLGTFFALIYMKIDQIMLRWFADTAEVGQYAVAAQLSEAWYFIPTAIVASFFPRLIKLREESEARFTIRLQQLFDLLLLVALGVAVVMTFLAKPLILLVFGEQYEPSASILVIHIWAALFIFMRAALSKWILIEGVLVFSLITQGAGALVNVLANLALIPQYGGQGAAIATLVSYAAASFLSLALYKRTRPIFWLMANALAAPVRYPVQYLLKRKAN